MPTPERPGRAVRRAVVVGFDYPARYLAGLMNEHGSHWKLEVFPETRIGRVGTMRALWRLKGADALISFGGPGPNAALALAAHEQHIPIIVIWAGTDSLIAAKNPHDLAVTKREVSADIAVAPWLADELRTLGVAATYQAIVATDPPPSTAPLPERFTVLTYLPVPRRGFYGEDRVYEIAYALPDVRFIVVGGGGPNPSAPPNVEFHGWVDRMAPVIDEASVLLRLPEHDGFAMMVLESLARGRHVIWTYRFPGVRRVHGSSDAIVTLREQYEKHRRGELRPNAIGRKFVTEYFTRSIVAAAFETRLDKIASKRLPVWQGRRKRVVISGLGLFCAEVARQIEELHPEWQVQVLRLGSRLEILASMAHLTRADVWYSIGNPGTRAMHYWARLLQIPHVIHWVGTDIESLRSDESLRQLVQGSGAKHLVEFEWTASELDVLGISPDIVPLPLRQPGCGVAPLPERFTIMLYIPKSRPEFYGVRECERLLAEFAHEAPRVFVVGGGHVQAPAPVEVIDCGWRSDLRDLYKQSTVLIRWTPHDGLSLMVVETLSFGRYVLWSRPFPHATHVQSYQELKASLGNLFERHRAGKLHAQYTAAEFVRRRYATERCIDDIVGTLDTARTAIRPTEAFA